MALSLTESANLMNDFDLRGRVKVAALKYASYVMGQPNLTQSIARWVQATTTNPDQAAIQLIPMVVMDPAVQDGGKDIPDEALQATVETVLKRMI